MSSPPVSPPRRPADSGSGSSTLSADSTYDDQGLIFSLILGAVLLALYVPLVLYLVGTSRLWLKRFYRPNHTIEPPPRTATPPASPTTTTGGRNTVRGGSDGAAEAREAAEGGFPIHETDDSVTARAPQSGTACQPVRRRRKRLGISLPYRSTMFYLPSWRDWISIEESVPHLEGALSDHHVNHVTAARFTGTRSYVPLNPTTTGRQSHRTRGEQALAVADVTIADSPNSGPATPVTTPAAAAAALSPSTPLSSYSASSATERQVRRRYGSTDAADHHGAHSSSEPSREGNEGNTSSPTRACTAATRATEEEVGDARSNLPKTPLDPQVALYTFTLKFFASLMILGECFTIWISVVASQEDYNEYIMVKADTRRCHRMDANETGCLLKRPFCEYMGEDVGCVPVALPGLYDLTAKNIRPRSWRWWPVVLLNCGFCLVMVCLTVFYVKRVNKYVHDVMLHQMKHALGYRVACVRGIDAEEMKSVSVFSSSFLQERSYFLPSPNHNDGGRRGGGRGASAARGSPVRSPTDLQRDRSLEDEFDYYEQLDCNGFDCLFGIVGCHYYSTHRSDAVFTRPGRVKQILFTRKPPAGMYRAIGNAESAMADLQDVIADEKAIKRKLRRRQLRAIAESQQHQQHQQQPQQQGRGHRTLSPQGSATQRHHVRHTRNNLNNLLFSFASPASSSGDTSVESQSLEPTSHSLRAQPQHRDSPREEESATVLVEETHSGGRRHSSHAKTAMYTGESVLDAEDNVDDLVLYTRSCTWTSCCQDVPAVPYYERRLRTTADELNRMIAQVPQQPADSATFVIFADARSAFEFINLFRARYGGWWSSATANIAGPPGQIISNNVLTDKVVLGIRYFLVFVVYIALVFFYSIPIGMLGSLENLSYIPGIGQSFSEYYVATVPAWLRNIINAYLPVLALSLFYVILPDILRVMVVIMGAFNKAECDAGQLYLQYIFMVLTAVIFQAALQGGFAQLAFLVSAGEGRFITEFFVACVAPSKVGYFYAKVIMALSFSAWNDLVDPVGILKAFLLRGRVHVQRNYDALFMPCEMEYPKRYSFDLMILAIGLLFHMTMPVLGLFVALYFIVRYATQRAKLYDRYRPTLSPAQDCTDFTVCAQVLRCVMWLYVLAETGGVLLLSLRKHGGGVLVCSLTLATSMGLLVYVHFQTRTWMATLGRVRTFSQELAEHRRQQHQQQQQQERQRRHAATTTGSPAAASERDANATAHTDASFSSAPSLSGLDADDARAPDMHDEGATMDTYENLRFTLFDDSHSNPFIGYLLPRIPDVSCRYQPKHQRLAPLDVDAEVGKMKRSVFVVERYWDKGMTYYEADVEEQEPALSAQGHGGGGTAHQSIPRATRQSHSTSPPPPLPIQSTEQTTTGTRGGKSADGYVELDVVHDESLASPLQRRQQQESEVLRDSIVVPPRAPGSDVGPGPEAEGKDTEGKV